MSFFGLIKKEKTEKSQNEEWEELSINSIQKIISNQEKDNLDTIKILQSLETIIVNQKNILNGIEIINSKINDLEYKINPKVFTSYLRPSSYINYTEPSN